MKTAKIAELKAHLSKYLRLVRKGERILVLDRDEPVAQLVPLPGKSETWRERLAREGRLRLGTQDWRSLKLKARASAIDIQSILRDVREDVE